MSLDLTPARRDTALDFSLLIIRVIVGSIFAAHGGQKMWGWFEGPGLAAVVSQMGTLGYLVSVGEFFGGVGMILGFLTRFSAASNLVIMLGAIAMVHGKNGFFQAKGGYEYNLALIGLLAPLVLLGAGRFAIGRFLPFPKARGTSRPIAILE